MLAKKKRKKSQSLSQSYGSILPTSLTHIFPSLEAVHLGDLMRFRYGHTALRRGHFHGQDTQARPAETGSSRHPAASPTNSLPRRCHLLTRKDNSPQPCVPRLPFVARCRTRRVVPEFSPDSLSSVLRLQDKKPSLRTDSLMANCCSHETLLLFSLQGSHLNSCYSHQDLHQLLFHAAPPPRFCTTAAPPYPLHIKKHSGEV